MTVSPDWIYRALRVVRATDDALAGAVDHRVLDSGNLAVSVKWWNAAHECLVRIDFPVRFGETEDHENALREAMREKP